MQCIECARPAQARGLCNTHYHQARRAWLGDGIDLFPPRSERARAIRLRPVTCRYRACVQGVYLHDVCADHLADTLAAGHRATLRTPRARLGTLTRARYGAPLDRRTAA